MPVLHSVSNKFSFIQPVGGGMFGRSLAETVKAEMRRGGGYVPLIVHKCVDFIKANGKSTVYKIHKLAESKSIGKFIDYKVNRKPCTSLKLSLYSVKSIFGPLVTGTLYRYAIGKRNRRRNKTTNSLIEATTPCLIPHTGEHMVRESCD